MSDDKLKDKNRLFEHYVNSMEERPKADTVIANCNAITFLNNGTSTVLINNFPLLPGIGIAFEGNQWEINKTHYRITFTGTGVNSCWIFRKTYQ